uniref:Uncharacterized protein n=1 Tax=Encephalitozoon cuniculi TaxID=6035 RepID=M1KMS3_ENCCN|nr:hypothetical protein ECU04_1650 [Encephalitozoon cuniculi]
MKEIFKAISFKDFQPVEIYKKTRGRFGMRFVDLVNRIFRHNDIVAGRPGQQLASGARARIQGMTSFLSAEEKRKEEEMLRKIKEHGLKLCTKEKQEEMIKA